MSHLFKLAKATKARTDSDKRTDGKTENQALESPLDWSAGNKKEYSAKAKEMGLGGEDIEWLMKVDNLASKRKLEMDFYLGDEDEKGRKSTNISVFPDRMVTGKNFKDIAKALMHDLSRKG